MGYNLSIGERAVNVDSDLIWFDVKAIDGVRFGAPIDSCGASPPTHTNACYPGYVTWHAFAERVGLSSVFFGINGNRQRCLIPNADPGVIALTGDHLQAFEHALANYKSPISTRTPDYDLIRLEWLVWWTRWALTNCKYPSFARG